VTPIRHWSTASKVFIVLLVVVVGGYLGGCLGRTSVSGDEAIRIARAEIDFVPEETNAELGKKGFPPRAVWGITFWIPAADGEEGFERRTAVEVDADTGDVIAVHVDY